MCICYMGRWLALFAQDISKSLAMPLELGCPVDGSAKAKLPCKKTVQLKSSHQVDSSA